MERLVSKHTGGMSFDTVIDGHKITADADADFGGEGKGPRPKPMVLQALTGCTGMDVISLLNKMRVEYSDFSVTVEAELTDEHPKYYNKIHLIYSIKTTPAFHAKVEKAIDLSQERYCGVSYMLKQSSELTHEIQYI